MVVSEEATREQVTRILESETFRGSEVLRRLLRFLAEKSLSGEADQLKEYTIGIDALGKPPQYDPRQDSVVRIQVGRLRQKLADYYRSEGGNDPIVFELPKGHFRLNWEVGRAGADPAPARELEVVPQPKRPLPTVRILSVALALAVVWGAYSSVRLWRATSVALPVRTVWTPEMRELWQPITSATRPLIVSVAAPLFVGFQGVGLYRDLSLNRWEDVLVAPQVNSIRRALKDPRIFPMYYYTGFGNMTAVFRLGELLGGRGPNVSIIRSDRLSWQQVVDDNVLFLGPPRLYTEQLRSLPIELEFNLDESGIHSRHPRPGEPESLSDNYPSIRGPDAASAPDNGEVYALVTHTPGPLGSGDIECFNSNHSPGTMAAMEAFTTPVLAAAIVAKLRQSDGHIPRYYQVVLRARYKDGVPTEITYVMHRELHTGVRGGQANP